MSVLRHHLIAFSAVAGEIWKSSGNAIFAFNSDSKTRWVFDEAV
jgi:hypothetical protein